MQSVSSLAAEPTSIPRAMATTVAAESAYAGYQIIRRNGAVVMFEPNKIAVALMKAFLAVHGTQGAASASVRETVDALTEIVVRALPRAPRARARKAGRHRGGATRGGPSRCRRRPARAARPGGAEGAGRGRVQGARRRCARRADPRRDAPQSLRRRADRRSAQGRDPRRPHA